MVGKMKRLILCWLAIGVGWSQGPLDVILWAPKPKQLPRYTPPHKPITRWTELKKKHQGKPAWREVIVDDEHLHSEYIQTPPGLKEAKQMHPDTRTWWVIMEGQIRFEIEGQPPFVATKGSMVQVPMQTIFSLETVGDRPAVRFETNIAGAKTLYVQQADAPKMPGWDWLRVRLNRTGNFYDRNNKPHVTFDEVAQALEQGKVKGTQRIVEDARGAANFIYGYEKNLPPVKPGERGHYHPEGAEYWLILAGQIRYAIEGQGVIIAGVGDVVYVPKFTFHLPRWYGPGPSCRLAMNGFPYISHLFDAD
jgi:mannose-6-phosphate isomerase-like protein (cupin superfamily)